MTTEPLVDGPGCPTGPEALAVPGIARSGGDGAHADARAPAPAPAPREIIPGYRMVAPIGAGGYGEVWRVEAPGGLAKAAKIVFGHSDEKRAADESKALWRIKDVRHPFLLSLERIEVV
ncbi:MAG: hypothetical protein AB7O38_26665, partial [Pirellulaceae bacterium]